jgi:arthrofactin-type cyclic lipopeptide synthetase C
VYIAGANVARGYLHRAELTAERFLRDPFSADPLARMYKTGDLGRWQADGTIEYLGRNDDQVKIRGFRIELGEIEAQLARHPDVKETAVIARESVPGVKRLVAYIVPRVAATIGIDELRRYLTSTLPEHMVPSAFVLIERLPLTPSGKLDRRSLPEPGIDAYVSQEYEVPQGEVEETLANIWEEVLKIDRVGRHDNFFELGGHSLLGMRVVTLVAERTATNVSVASIFRYPTIVTLAEYVESLQPAQHQVLDSADVEFEERVL